MKKKILHIYKISLREIYLSEAFNSYCFPKPDSKFKETLCTFEQNLFSLLSVNSQRLSRVILSFKILQ